jgi:hypothetical protein
MGDKVNILDIKVLIYSKNYNPLKQSAKEFFHYQLSVNNDLNNVFKYYSIFSSLNQSKPRRYLGCAWKDEGVTLDSRGEVYYCAVASNSLGSLRENNGNNLFFDKQNIEYRKKIVRDNCNNCKHDYTGKVSFDDAFIFVKYKFFEKFSMKLYELKIKFML